MQPDEIHALLIAKAREIGCPTMFRADLTEHDLACLRNHRPPQFLWVVRQGGTDIFWTQEGLVWFRAMRNPASFGDEHLRCFWWNGQRLAAITAREAEQRLTKLAAEFMLLAKTCQHEDRYSWEARDDDQPSGMRTITECRTCYILIDGHIQPETAAYKKALR